MDEEDVFYFFWSELLAALEGRLSVSSMSSVVRDRRSLHLDVKRQRHRNPADPREVRPRSWAGDSWRWWRGPGSVAAVSTLKDAEQMTPGQVLVVEGATPAWAVLLRRAAAVVATAGGPYSHTAIMCRELGIPCVLSVGDDLLRFVSSGDTLRVDGSSGTVSVLSRSPVD